MRITRTPRHSSHLVIENPLQHWPAPFQQHFLSPQTRIHTFPRVTPPHHDFRDQRDWVGGEGRALELYIDYHHVSHSRLGFSAVLAGVYLSEWCLGLE